MGYTANTKWYVPLVCNNHWNSILELESNIYLEHLYLLVETVRYVLSSLRWDEHWEAASCCMFTTLKKGENGGSYEGNYHFGCINTA